MRKTRKMGAGTNVLYAIAACALVLLWYIEDSVIKSITPESTAPPQKLRVVTLPPDVKAEARFAALLAAIPKNETDPLAGNVTQYMWKTVKACARHYFKIDKHFKEHKFRTISEALKNDDVSETIEACAQCDRDQAAKPENKDVHSVLLLADGEGMKKQCLSHVRELVKNPAKILTDPCVFSHDCKSKDGDGGDAAPPPPPKKKSGGDGVPAGLGNAALRQLRAAKSG